MSKEAVRAALKAFPDGLNKTDIAKFIGKKPEDCIKAIRIMPDVYIDRWVKTKRGRVKYTPVYLLADIPENAPMPD